MILCIFVVNWWFGSDGSVMLVVWLGVSDVSVVLGMLLIILMLFDYVSW